MKTHFGGGPDPKGIGKVGKQTGAMNERANAKAEGSTQSVKVPAAYNQKISIGKGDALHGKMAGQSFGGYGGANVHSGKYHK